MVLYFMPHSTTLAGCTSYISQAYVIESFTLTGIEGSYGCNDIESGYGYISIILTFLSVIFVVYDYAMSHINKNLGYFVKRSVLIILVSSLIFVVTAPFGPHASLIPLIGGENVKTTDIDTNIEPMDNNTVQIQIGGHEKHDNYLTVTTVSDWNVDEAGGVVNKTRLVNEGDQTIDINTDSITTLSLEEGDLIVVHFGNQYMYNEVYRYTDNKIESTFEF